MLKMLELYLEYDQSVWLDYMDRGLLQRGDLRLLVTEGVRGVTSNPTILHKEIVSSNDYDDLIYELLQGDKGMDDAALYEQVVISDVQLAADVLEPVYVSSEGADGFVSLGVSPHLAFDTHATVEAARHLWRSVNRPNLMIKVPATEPGLSAMESLIAEGINVNATLLFSVDRYRAVTAAYVRGLSKNDAPQKVASVASFFISEMDTKIDSALKEIGTPEVSALKGCIAIANAKMAYLHFKEVIASDEFETQRQRGASAQRLLWGDTSIKNFDYPKLHYVEQLIAPATVNAIPLKTLEQFQLHGKLDNTLENEVGRARRELETLTTLGIDLKKMTWQLEMEGIKKLADSYDQLLLALKEKRLTLSRNLVNS